MKYNQPLDQPTNPNAPYYDGNPAAGLEGSIVPASSVEYDQREVVEVINAANIRHYTDFTNTPCAPPSNTDLQQLRKAIEGFIRTVPIPQWYIDTHVVWTVHGAGAMYPDLLTALHNLSMYIITHHGQVTLQVAAGRWDYGANSIILDHPNSDRIILQGANLARIPTGVDYPCTGYSAAARSNDRTTTLNQMRTAYTTEIDFAGGSLASWGVGMTIKNLLIVGDRLGSGGNSIGCWDGILHLHQCSTCNTGIGCSVGMLILETGTISATGAAWHGLAVSQGGHIYHSNAATIYTTANDYNGVGCGFDCGVTGYSILITTGNAGAGAMLSVLGNLQFSSGSKFNYNAINGVFVDQGTFTLIFGNSDTEFYYNGGAGLYVCVGSSAQAGASAPGVVKFFGNAGGYNVNVGSGSYCYLPGATGVAGLSSPAVNTLSYDGSYIAN